MLPAHSDDLGVKGEVSASVAFADGPREQRWITLSRSENSKRLTLKKAVDCGKRFVESGRRGEDLRMRHNADEFRETKHRNRPRGLSHGEVIESSLCRRVERRSLAVGQYQNIGVNRDHERFSMIS